MLVSTLPSLPLETDLEYGSKDQRDLGERRLCCDHRPRATLIAALSVIMLNEIHNVNVTSRIRIRTDPTLKNILEPDQAF